jgi:hypothetical protein
LLEQALKEALTTPITERVVLDRLQELVSPYLVGPGKEVFFPIDDEAVQIDGQKRLGGIRCERKPFSGFRRPSKDSPESGELIAAREITERSLIVELISWQSHEEDAVPPTCVIGEVKIGVGEVAALNAEDYGVVNQSQFHCGLDPVIAESTEMPLAYIHELRG